MAHGRAPFNYLYCIAVRCSHRHGNTCMQAYCVRPGNEKRATYYTKYHALAKGDVPE